MNSRIVGLRVASVIFGLGFLGQLTRLIMGFRVCLGSHVIPVWYSGVAMVVAALLCWWFWRLSPEPKPATPPAPPKA